MGDTEHARTRVAIFEFIELFYNPVRQHSHLKGLSPMHFERAGARLTTCP
jgi:transposase InsO family protein